MELETYRINLYLAKFGDRFIDNNGVVLCLWKKTHIGHGRRKMRYVFISEVNRAKITYTERNGIYVCDFAWKSKPYKNPSVIMCPYEADGYVFYSSDEKRRKQVGLRTDYAMKRIDSHARTGDMYVDNMGVVLMFWFYAGTDMHFVSSHSKTSAERSIGLMFSENSGYLVTGHDSVSDNYYSLGARTVNKRRRIVSKCVFV